MYLSDMELHKLQRICLELVKEVDRVCRLNGIEYTLDGGTLLGAIREHGFIPWDDDADIAMTRSEYQKFYKACKKDLDKEHFFLQEFKTDPHYPWGYSKLRMKGTHLIQTGQEHLRFQDGIFIDIFIYDPVPNNFILRRIHYFECFCIRKCQYAVVGKKASGKLALRVVYKLLDRIPKRWINSWLNRLIIRTNKRGGVLSSHKTYPYFRKECKYGLPSICFKGYKDVLFENHTFRCMKKYDLYLTRLYGDYMTPPPPSGRKHYPVGYIDFGVF